MTETAQRITELLPTPDAVRDRLAANARERDLLKSLLKLSQRAAKQGCDSDTATPSKGAEDAD